VCEKSTAENAAQSTIMKWGGVKNPKNSTNNLFWSYSTDSLDFSSIYPELVPPKKAKEISDGVRH